MLFLIEMLQTYPQTTIIDGKMDQNILDEVNTLQMTSSLQCKAELARLSIHDAGVSLFKTSPCNILVILAPQIQILYLLVVLLIQDTTETRPPLLSHATPYVLIQCSA